MLNIQKVYSLDPRKVIIWDIECTDMTLEVNTYELKNRIRYFPIDTIKRDWTLLGGAWKELGKDQTYCVSVSSKDPLNDEGVVRKLHEVLSEADVLIGHNSDNFDIKKFNARAIQYGLRPLAPKTQIDTLKIARKYFKFTSNQLRYVANILQVAAKDESPDWSLILEGDPDELRAMREYNKQDVIVTEQVYLKLAPYHHTHPKIAPDIRDIEGHKVENCPVCGSTNTKANGWRMSGKSYVQQMYCKDHGGYYNGQRKKNP